MKDKNKNKIVEPREKFTDKDKAFIDKAVNFMSANVKQYVSLLKRRAGNISSREMSRRTGVSIAVISDIEGNKYLPKMAVLLKLAYGMNSNFFALLNHMWNLQDAQKWSQITNTPLPQPEVDMSNFVNNEKESTNGATTSLADILEKEGLTKADAKEILDYIEFKKLKRKRRQ